MNTPHGGRGGTPPGRAKRLSTAVQERLMPVVNYMGDVLGDQKKQVLDRMAKWTWVHWCCNAMIFINVVAEIVSHIFIRGSPYMLAT